MILSGNVGWMLNVMTFGVLRKMRLAQAITIFTSSRIMPMIYIIRKYITQIIAIPRLCCIGGVT